MRALISRLNPVRMSKRKVGVTLTPSSGVVAVQPRGLRVSGVSVSFGGVQAVRGVSLDVCPARYMVDRPDGAGNDPIDALRGLFECLRAKSDLVTKRFLAGRPVAVPKSGFLARFNPLSCSRISQLLRISPSRRIDLRGTVVCQILVWPAYHPWTGGLRRVAVSSELSRLIERVHRKSHSVNVNGRHARSIASSPSVLLLDEPAAGLDDHEAAELALLIRQLVDEWGILTAAL